MRYRGTCNNCDWRGQWRNTEAQAQKDALQHQIANPEHETDIEVEQARDNN